MPIYSKLPEFVEKLPLNGGLVAVDFGRKSIGVAISDDARHIASPLLTISEKKFQARADRILAICNQRAAAGIVFGLPLNMDGTQNAQCQAVRAFAFNLNQQTELPIAFWDERLSSSEADHFMVKMGVKKSNRKATIHQVAASIILQWFLDELHRE